MLGTSPGDFNSDGALAAADVDLLASAIRSMVEDPQFDINEDGSVDLADHTFWIENVAMTLPGDADLSGNVDFRDFIALTRSFGESVGWAGGDFDGDGSVEFPDFLLLSANFSFEVGPFGSVPVPEPSSAPLLMLGTLAALPLRNRKRR